MGSIHWPWQSEGCWRSLKGHQSTQATKAEMKKQDCIKAKRFPTGEGTDQPTQWRGDPWNCRKYLQIIYPTRRITFQNKYKALGQLNSKNQIIQSKTGQRTWIKIWVFPEKTDEYTHKNQKKVFSITNPQRNANQSHIETLYLSEWLLKRQKSWSDGLSGTVLAVKARRHKSMGEKGLSSL